MKENRPVIVVEGVSDMNRLSTLVDADFVICNGSAVSEETLEYIAELAKVRFVLVLTDPDFPGKQIRNKIAQRVPSVRHAYIDRAKAVKGKKLGVAECEKEELLRALKEYVNDPCKTNPSLTMQDMIELGLTGSAHARGKRERLVRRFHIGYGNAKAVLKQLNMLGISREQVKECLDDSE